MMRKTLVLVDGSYFLFRAYHALPGLSNDKGEPSGAIYGVMNMLRKHLNEAKPDYFAVIFDPRGKTFRNDLYQHYKANRPPIPEDLAAQIQPLHDLIRAMGIPLLIVDGVEADDVIATLARRAANNDIKTLVSTGDKDLAQIVSERVHLLNTMNNVYLDPDGVKDKFGVPPERMVDYLTLVGDNADNIPGVRKVGPKTAAKWLAEYGSLDEIIAHADEVKGQAGENLRQCLPQLALVRELVTLRYDVDIELAPEDLSVGEADHAALSKMYAHWNFRGWREESEPRAFEDDARGSEYEVLLDEAALDKWIAAMEGAELLAFDTETTSLDYMQARLVGVSFAVAPGRAAYLPLAHDYPGAPVQVDIEAALTKLKPVLENKTIAKGGQNLKYDKNVLANYGIELAGIAHDTMLQSYLINSTATGRHDMDSLAKKHLNYETIHYEELVGKGAKQIRFNQVHINQAVTYAAEDADIVLRLHKVLYPEISALPELESLYQQVEMPLLSVLSKMERHGVIIDKDMLREQSREMEREMEKTALQAYELSGETFNLGSPQQIQTVLYEKMALPILAKTPKGRPSTAESTLQELAQKHELPRLILQYRGLSKLRSTYTEKLPLQVHSKTGRIHTSYHQAVAITGRLSSSDPNLQNIPIKTEAGRKIRRAFTCPQGYSLLAADYSQIELRIMAHLSGDPNLLEAFATGSDIHRRTAAEVFTVGADEVDNAQRRAAKAINFGLIYGMSAFGLARQLGITRGQAQDYIELYFKRYPGVKIYMDNIRAEAKERGYVETLFKRRLYLPDINAGNAARRQYAERTAINAPMQGSAADIIKIAMLEIDRAFSAQRIDAKMIMQVHDELVFEVADEDISACGERVSELMIGAASLNVPLEVDIGYGKNWDTAH